MKKNFTPLENAADFPASGILLNKRFIERDSRRSSPIEADGGIKPPSVLTVRERSSLTGFTLVELVVVIAIIAVLAAVIAPNAFKAIEKAQVSKAGGDIKTIGQAALQFYADTGRFPPAINLPPYGAGFLTNDDGNGSPIAGWDGPYLEKWPFHPWHRAVSDPTTYQWDYKDVDSDGVLEWCVEIGLGDVNGVRRNHIAGLIDKSLDGGDGPCAGKFRAYCPPGPANWDTWPKYIVVDE